MSFTDIEATNAMFVKHFTGDGNTPQVTQMRDGFAVLRLKTDASHMRPGNMVNGSARQNASCHRCAHLWRGA